MFSLSEGEIDQQKKVVVSIDDDLFKSFETIKMPGEGGQGKQSIAKGKSNEKQDVLEDKGWDEELDIRIE